MDTNTDGRTESGFPMRMALMWLRLAEDRAAPYLPPYRALQLADAIDRVIPVIRKAEIGP